MQEDQLISDYMRQQNEKLHETASYGVSGGKYADTVLSLLFAMSSVSKFHSMVDYGCGQGLLKKELVRLGWRGEIHEYDPAIAEKTALPLPASLVVCTDVMEHVEDRMIENVLTHVHGLADLMAYFSISTRPAGKNLPNGKNAHISLHDPDWWHTKIVALKWTRVYWRTYGKKKEPPHTVNFWCVK